MAKIIHITDIHICPEGKKIIGLDPNKRLLQCIDSINAHHPDADLCVITGDLTDCGDIESYRVLRRHLEGWSMPWRLILGNHDDRANFLAVFPEAPIDPSGFVQSTQDIDHSRLVFLDTLDPDSEQDGAGTLCKERMLWLTNCIEQSEVRPVLIFMHHPPKSLRIRYFEHMLLSTSVSFMTLITKYPAINHVAFGHLHLTTTGSWGGVSFSANRGTCHKIALNLSDMRAEYVRTGPAYDIILTDGDETIVHHVDPVGTMELLAVEYPDLTGGPGRIEYPAVGDTAKIEL